MNGFDNSDGGVVVAKLVEVIRNNKDYLSEVDGAIGDGDHGVNMNKGFGMASEKLRGEENLSEGFRILGNVLLDDIGGSMGPLYGSFFNDMGYEIEGKSLIGQREFGDMLSAGLNAILDIFPDGKVGDKTMLDALIPAVEAYNKATDENQTFKDALRVAASKAEEGKNTTKDMVARVGRASRLGERSRGVIDAGAASCALIIGSLCGAVADLLHE
jgi:dihydroxyacetone kinase-like protein